MLKAISCAFTFAATSALVKVIPHADTTSAVERGSQVINQDEKMIFAFELVRHGARGPFDDKKIEEFPVGEG
jgi:hypothetical protein